MGYRESLLRVVVVCGNSDDHLRDAAGGSRRIAESAGATVDVAKNNGRGRFTTLPGERRAFRSRVVGFGLGTVFLPRLDELGHAVDLPLELLTLPA